MLNPKSPTRAVILKSKERKFLLLTHLNGARLKKGERKMKSDDEKATTGPYDHIFVAAGLADMDVSEAAFMVMTMATKDMDDDIRLIMAEIKAMTKAKQRLRELIKDLNQWISKEMSKRSDQEEARPEQVTGPSPNGEFQVSDGGIGYSEPQPDVEDPDLVAECAAVYDLSHGAVTVQGMVSLLDELKGKLDGMNEMSEMISLRLQMTMDRRSKFIQTLSQMMKKFSTTQDILVQNIK